jgi:acyl carrier protein phosphodiesterase
MATANTDENPRVSAIRESIDASYRELNRLIDERLIPLTPDLLYQSPIPQEWTLMENLAHIVEFMSYWADEVAQLVAHPGQSFGRTQQHEGRLSAIREHGHDSLTQIQAALPDSYARLERVIDGLRDSDLELTGHHVRFGTRTLDWFIKEFITDHFASHLEQLRVALIQLAPPF